MIPRLVNIGSIKDVSLLAASIEKELAYIRSKITAPVDAVVESKTPTVESKTPTFVDAKADVKTKKTSTDKIGVEIPVSSGDNIITFSHPSMISVPALWCVIFDATRAKIADETSVVELTETGFTINSPDVGTLTYIAKTAL